MTGYCPVFDSDTAFITGLTGYVDCQMTGFSTEAYRLLSAPGSQIGLGLTGLLTLLVAFAGYRMLLGETPSVRGLVVIAARVGLVLALSTHWPAYQKVVYDVVTAGPASLVDTPIGEIGLISDHDGMLQRLQDIYARMRIPKMRVLQDGAVSPPAGAVASAQTSGGANVQALPPATTAALATRTDLPEPGFWFAVSTMAGLLTIRLVSGFALAFGPVFILAALFDGTRGLFVGWVRVLVASILASAGVSLVLAMEAAILMPEVARFAGHAGTTHSTSEIFATVTIFGFCILAMLGTAGYIAAAVRLPAWAGLFERLSPPVSLASGGARAMGERPAGHTALPDHTASVIRALRSSERLEAVALDIRTAPLGGRTAAAASSKAPSAAARLSDNVPRTHRRVTATQIRRDNA